MGTTQWFPRVQRYHCASWRLCFISIFSSNEGKARILGCNRTADKTPIRLRPGQNRVVLKIHGVFLARKALQNSLFSHSHLFRYVLGGFHSRVVRACSGIRGGAFALRIRVHHVTTSDCKSLIVLLYSMWLHIRLQ